MDSEKCPCMSGKSYAECCEPVIRGTRKAATPEELMRSRYSAYAKAEIDHIINSTHSAQRDSNDREEIRRAIRLGCDGIITDDPILADRPVRDGR